MAKKWFDPHNIDHCQAYRYFQKTGEWPEGFELHDVEVGGAYWQVSLMGKTTKAWIDQMLKNESGDD